MDKENDKNGLWETDRMQQLREGDNIVTPGGDISDCEVPLWYDEKLFNKAKETYKEYFASVNFGHLCGLLLSFYFTKAVKALRSTGQSETKHNLFHRYLATVRHVQKWYEGDVWNPKDPAHKSLSAVRSMHAKVANKMAALNDGVVYISQWDMAITQWAFIGPIILFRSKVGLHSCTEEQYESLIHFWRVIGYLLGVEDQYNLCTGDYEQVTAACNSVLEKEYIYRIEIADPSSVSMGKNVAAAMNMIDPMLTWESLTNYIHDLVDLPCPTSMSYTDWIYHWFLKFIMLFVLQFPLLRAPFNDLFRWRLDIADKHDLEFKATKKYFVPSRVKEASKLITEEA